MVVHEMTHSTVYGCFPIWFEEGVAYFLGYYLTNSVEKGATIRHCRAARDPAPTAKSISRTYGYYTGWELHRRAGRGYLFLKGLYDIEGIDGLGQIIRTLRTKTYNDQELLATIMQLTPDNLQTQMRKYYCDKVVGLARNYCVAGG